VRTRPFSTIDSAEQIERILPVLGEGMVTVERVEIIAYRGSRSVA
jgi:hypothetical protein